MVSSNSLSYYHSYLYSILPQGSRLAITFEDGSYLYFANGSFDDYCVYYNQPGLLKAIPPKDAQYLTALKEISMEYGLNTVYGDFVGVYNMTNPYIDYNVFSYICKVAKEHYNIEDSLRVAKILSILYMGMIAEECKKGAILKKRVKRLGVHQVLFGILSPEKAANYSKGKGWRGLDADCRNYGF